jgi:hypothetical protein
VPLFMSHSDALADAMALVAFPFLLGLFGSWVDSKLGTGSVVMFALVALGIVGAFATAYYRYAARIAQHDAGKPWTRGRAR